MLLFLRAFVRVFGALWGLSELLFLITVFRYHLKQRAVQQRQWWR